MIDKLGTTFRFQQEALRLRQQRQEVLSANIANSDTPQYKARDIPFSAALGQALERGTGAAPMALTSTRHLAGTGVASAPEMLYRQPMQSSMDGNTVEMDVERVNFADNALRYEANLTVLGSKIKSLLAAVQS